MAAEGGAGGPSREPLRDLSYIMRANSDVTNFRYFICVIHGQLPRNDEIPVKRLPGNTIFIQPGFGDDCGKAIYTHALDYFENVLLETPASRRQMFAYFLGHFGHNEGREINPLLSTYMYNITGDMYVDKVVSLSPEDTDAHWGVHEAQFGLNKKFTRLVRDDAITNRVRKASGAGVSIERNSELITAINTRYPCGAGTGKEANIIIMVSCSVAQPSRPARTTRGCTGAYCDANPADYSVAIDQLGVYTRHGFGPSAPTDMPPPRPTGKGYVKSLAGYIEPANLRRVGIKATNEYIGHKSVASRLPAPKPAVVSSEECGPDDAGCLNRFLVSIGLKKPQATATATAKVKADRKRRNRTLRRRRNRQSRRR